MSKFKKRIAKITTNLNNAVVVGTAFNKLDEILDLFNTIFIIKDDSLKIRAKNIVYLPNLHELHDTSSVTMSFVDKTKVDDLSILVPLLARGHSMILIEGTEVIGRDKSKLLYTYGFEAVLQSKGFHLWKQ